MTGRIGKAAGAVLLAAALAACGGAAAPSEEFVASDEALRGVSDASLSLPAWTGNRAITAKVQTPTGGTAKTACLSLTAITAQAGDAWTACAATDAVAGLTTTKSVSKTLTLADQEGLQKVWVRFKAASGDTVESVKSSTIVLDRTAPTSLDIGTDADEARAGVGILLLSPAFDLRGSGVKGYSVVASVGSGVTTQVPSKCAASGTVKAASCTLETKKLFCDAVGGVALKRGDKVALQVCAVDNVGNSTDGLVLAPVTVAAADPSHSSPNLAEDIVLVTDTGLEGWDRVTTDGTFRFSARAYDGAVVSSWSYSVDDGATWTETALAANARAAGVTIVGNAGFKDAKKTVKVKVKDSLGAESGTWQLEITVDQTAPKAPGILAVNQEFASFSVTVANAEAADAIDTDPRIIVTASESKAPPAKCAETGGAFRVTNHGQADFSSGTIGLEGALVSGRRYFLMACAVDDAGNVSEGAATASALLFKDHKVPPYPIGRPLLIMNSLDWPKYVSGSTIRAEIRGRAHGHSKLTHYTSVFVADGETVPNAPLATATWTAFTKAKTFQQEILSLPVPATLKNGRYTLFVFVKDDLENISGNYFSSNFELDTAAPTLSIVNPVTIGGLGGMVALQVDVEVTNAAAAGALAYAERPYASAVVTSSLQVRFKSGLAAPTATATSLATCKQLPDRDDLAYRCLTPFAFTLLATASSNKVSFLASILDAAGNKGTTKAETTASLSLQADTSAPEVTGFEAAPHGGGADGTLRFVWTAPSDADVLGFVLVGSDDGSTTAPASCDEGKLVYAYSVSMDADRDFESILDPSQFLGYFENAPKAFRLCTTDLAGNLSPGVTAVLPE